MHISRKVNIGAFSFLSKKYFRLSFKRQKKYLKLSPSEYDLQQEAVNKIGDSQNY